MTREEYLINKVEQKVVKIIELLNERKENNAELVQEVNLKGFLYQCARIEPLDYLIYLCRILTKEEIERLNHKDE